MVISMRVVTSYTVFGTSSRSACKTGCMTIDDVLNAYSEGLILKFRSTD
jgi:hypothetical protein